MSEELKSCPFCGGTEFDKEFSEHYIRCKSCGTDGPICQSEQTPAEAWNTRAAPAAQAVDAPTAAWLDLEKLRKGGMAYATSTKVNHRQTELVTRAALAASVRTACKTCCDQGEVFVLKGDVEPWMESEPDPVMAACLDCAAPVREPDKASFHSHLHYHRARQLIQRVIRSGALAIEDPGHDQQTLVSLEADLCAFLKIGASPVQHSGCDRCGAPTLDACNDNGCAYLENGNGAPVQEPVATVTSVEEKFEYGKLVIRKVEISTYTHGQLNLQAGDNLYSSRLSAGPLPKELTTAQVEAANLAFHQYMQRPGIMKEDGWLHSAWRAALGAAVEHG